MAIAAAEDALDRPGCRQFSSHRLKSRSPGTKRGFFRPALWLAAKGGRSDWSCLSKLTVRRVVPVSQNKERRPKLTPLAKIRHMLLMRRMERCNHCQQELIEIDNRGERLAGFCCATFGRSQAKGFGSRCQRKI